MSRGEEILSRLRSTVDTCSRILDNVTHDMGDALARAYILRQCEVVVDQVAAIQTTLRRAHDDQAQQYDREDAAALAQKGGDDVRIG